MVFNLIAVIVRALMQKQILAKSTQELGKNNAGLKIENAFLNGSKTTIALIVVKATSWYWNSTT